MSEPITFWYGCNVQRHGDIIHSCLDILRALDFDPAPVGGPDYCCGTVKDANQVAAGGMATRTMGRLHAKQRERVVAWCPSCHSHMHDFMEHANDREFGMNYLVELLYEHRRRLKPMLKNEIALRVVLHKHVGFQDLVPTNRMVPELLRMIPGLEVVDHDYASPGYICSSFAPIPKALHDINEGTFNAVRATNADAVVVIFHQCYREILGLEAIGATQVYNYIHLIARSMGLQYEDEYKAWKKAGAVTDPKRVEAIGMQFYERAIAPELKKRPSLKT
jgi:Fe-S oxidoreductase